MEKYIDVKRRYCDDMKVKADLLEQNIVRTKQLAGVHVEKCGAIMRIVVGILDDATNGNITEESGRQQAKSIIVQLLDMYKNGLEL